MLYHILETGGKVSFIKTNSFNKAVEFFNKTHKCLEMLLNDKSVSDYDNLYNFLVDNRNRWISKTELRNQKFVSGRDFKSWLNDALTEISIKAENNGFCIIQRAIGNRNQGIEIALYEPDLYKFESKVEGNVVKGDLIKLDNSDIEVNTI